MIVGIGIDLVEVPRIRALLETRGAQALARLFTEAEAARCRTSRCPEESFAARFAAKEAFFKGGGGGGGGGGRWREVEVVSDARGAPSLRLSGRAAEVAARLGVRRTHLSLTHTEGLAAAYLILEGEGAAPVDTGG